MRSNRKLTEQEVETLNRIKPQIRYSTSDIVFLTNIHSEFIDNWALCTSCSNKLQELKNNVYGFYAQYKDKKLKEEQLVEHQKIVAENQAKLAELGKKDKEEKEEKMKTAKKDIEKYKKGK